MLANSLAKTTVEPRKIQMHGQINEVPILTQLVVNAHLQLVVNGVKVAMS